MYVRVCARPAKVCVCVCVRFWGELTRPSPPITHAHTHARTHTVVKELTQWKTGAFCSSVQIQFHLWLTIRVCKQFSFCLSLLLSVHHYLFSFSPSPALSLCLSCTHTWAHTHTGISPTVKMEVRPSSLWLCFRQMHRDISTYTHRHTTYLSYLLFCPFLKLSSFSFGGNCLEHIGSSSCSYPDLLTTAW